MNMLLVRTYLDKSAIHGLGVFAGEVIRKGTKVRWKWGSSWAEGTVDEVRHDDVSRTSKGEQVTRHGTDDDPALVIQQDDGTVVLKREHEVERAPSAGARPLIPRCRRAERLNAP